MTFDIKSEKNRHETKIVFLLNKYRKVWTWSVKALKTGPSQTFGTESQTDTHTEPGIELLKVRSWTKIWDRHSRHRHTQDHV